MFIIPSWTMKILSYHALALLIGFVLDRLIGDPHSMPHPVKLIGKLISSLEKNLYDSEDKKRSGLILVIVTVLITGFVTLITVKLSYRINISLGIIVESIYTFYTLAAKSLKDESEKVIRQLREGGIEQGRKALSMIVGRDTDNLSETEIIKACVETVAENASDGVIAPLFYLGFFGAVGGMIYKAVNTMDSMIGYNNEKYSEFGYYAAKTDDVFNYIPSRITAVFICLSPIIYAQQIDELTGVVLPVKERIKEGFRIFLRDRFNHKSPNSAQSESAMAGILSIRLGGGAYYFGKWVEKPFVGDNIREIKEEDVFLSNKIMYFTEVIMLVLILILN